MKLKLPLSLLCLLLISCERGDIEIFDARPMFSSDLEDRWILVNYWADWCPPCIKEIPEINSFMAKHPEVIVLAFNFDRLEAEDLRPQIKKFGIQYPSLITHPKGLWGIATPKTLPATYFISPGGEIAFTSLKPQDEKSLSLAYAALQQGS
ncbi:TlpA family protein disulfide reductase [Gammaproteobacteria bacterium]|jgi:thiol-disulfide isomerase/thioredoxin|nr:TlpA family protein disulfide reductase [Gammaproteobacteria bacterium]MDA9154231.1 TlpA family protein disulfide reductase [Gammaproteobacteria bacterium]MDA9341150.1 TlpA family protein disulfide reductase [Gammaproteobacteria bacterium]MDB9790896.1 TlpA family protein disulfide reductase [Gammaproteobacteria bacterium]MDC1300868.1 TlpA family protein disulfide reductase [Gammaproteobacteria bacterium]|tara:strand:+ start:22 stop:474 length:453 start_codon:yes stop_codon:yes gene_type:complete